MSKLSPRWINYHMNLAQAASTGSKDGSTKVGAVLVRPDRTTASTGFNGFPALIPDNPEILNNPIYRQQKLDIITHAEINCMDNAHEPLNEMGLVVTRHPCFDCAKAIIRKQIKAVYYLINHDFENKWKEQLIKAKDILHQANIPLYPIVRTNSPIYTYQCISDVIREPSQYTTNPQSDPNVKR